MTVSGHVATLPLADLVQSAATGRRSCRIHLRGRLVEGELYIQGGDVVHALFGDLVGNDAAFAMMAEGDAWFDVEAIHPEPPIGRTVTLPWRQLLMEGVRRQDEGTLRMPTPLSLAIPFEEEAAALEAHLNGTRRRHLMLLGGVGVAAFAVSAVVSALLLSEGELPSQRPVVVRDASPRSLDGGTVARPADRPPSLVEGAPPVSPVPRVSFTPTILLRLKIDPQGRVEAVELTERRPDLAIFEQAAQRAVRAYRFRPATEDGQAVSAWISWPVTFAPAPIGGAQRRQIAVTGAEVLGGTLGTALAKAFEAANPGVTVTWDTLNSRAGFGALLDGTADLVATVRPLTPAELSDARRLGLALGEHVIGHDAMVPIVHPSNPVQKLELEALARLFRGDVRTWSEVGGPPGKVKPLVGRSFTDMRPVLDPLLGPPGARPRFAAGTRYVEAEEEILRGVAATPKSLGMVSRVMVTDEVRAVPLFVKGEPRVPDATSIRGGKYPLRRGLYLYTFSPPTTDIGRFIQFLGSSEARTMIDRWGFVTGETETGRAAASSEGCDDASAAKRPRPFRLTFPRFQTAVPTSARKELTRVAEQVAGTKHQLLIVGHSDSQDGAESATSDAQSRAQNVARFLADSGVSPRQMEVRSEGADAPIDSNRTSHGRRRNRRVDVYVIEQSR